MKCLNIKSPEFITLYNKTTVHPLKLLMMVNKYFSDNPDVEEMPTTTQLGLTAKDLKQSVTKVDEHLLSLMQDGFISYQNNEVEYKGAKYSKKGFLKNMYGLSVSDNAEGSIDPVAYFSLRKSTANNLLTALDGYISTQEELNQYFKTYIDNSPNVFDAIRNNDAFVEYVKGIIGEQKETLQVEYDVDDSLPSINVYAGNYENSQLSNFSIRPFSAGVETSSGYRVYEFSSVEQAFHFAKAAMVNNASVAKEVLKTTKGKTLKQLTNKENLKMTQEQIKEWDNVSKDIMTEFIYQSFLQNLYHGELLLSTGKARITHNQDNTRWKKDFPDALMTARKRLQQIANEDYTLIGKRLNRKPKKEEIFNFQVKINNVFFEEMVDSKEFQVVDSDIEDSKPRQLKYSDYQKLFFNDLEIVSDPENLLLFEVFEEKFESFVRDSTDVSLDAFINNMQLFFDEYYNPNLSEEQSNGLQEAFVRLEKILPDISPFKIIDRNNFVEGQLDLFETEELKPQQQKVTSFNKNPNPINIGARFPKDQTKADYADSMIGFGEPNTSTAKYAARFGDKSNKGVYQKGETVFISVNGRGRANLESNLAKTKAEIDKAISQGVGRFVADNKDVANSSHNSVGEGVIRQYLLDKGMLYVEYDGIGFYVNNLQQQDSVKPVIDLSREWSGDLESSPVYTKGSVNTMRTKSAKPNEHFGNPWSEGGYSGTIETSSVPKAVQNYKDWLTTDKYDFDHPLKMMDDFEFNKFYTQIKKMSNSNNNIVQEQFANNYLLNLLNRKRWILDQINQGKLDGANLLYSKKLMDRGQGSHAIALAEVVEQLRSQQQKLEPYNIDQALANSQRLFQELIDVAFKDLFNTPESIDNYRVYYDVEIEGLGDVRKERKLKPTDRIKLIVDENGAEYYAIELDQPDAIDKLIGGIGYTDILLKVANDKRIYVDVAPIVLDRMDKLFLDKKGLELVGYDDFVNKIYDIYGDNEGNGKDVVKAIGEKIPEFNRIVNNVGELDEQQEKQEQQQQQQQQQQQEIKPGVQELFESNPELANQVYEALGFVGDLNKLGIQDIKTYVGDKLTTVEDTSKSLISMILDGTYDEFTDAELTSFEKKVYIYLIERMSKNMYLNRYVSEVMEPYDDGYVEDNFLDDLKEKYNVRARTEFDVYEEFLKYKKEFSIDSNEVIRIFNIGNSAISDKIALKLYMALLSENEGYSGLPDNLVELELQKVTPEQKQEALKIYSQYVEQTGKQDIKGFKEFVNQPTNNDSLFGLNIQNEEQLKFHINTTNVISKFLENIGVKERLVSEFLSEDGSVVEGAIAAANFIEGTIDIIDDLNKGRAQAWDKLPEEAAHWWYRLLKENSPLKKALWESHKVALKNDELYAGKYGKLVNSPADLTEESIGQLIAEAIKRIETKEGNPSDYSFFKKFLEWINSIINVFKNTTVDPFEVAAMKILSSDMSDLMTLEEYRKLNNIVNFADVLTDQSVIPVDYTLLEDIDQINYSVIYDENTNSEVPVFYFADSPYFSTKEELDNWVTKKYGNLLIKRQKQKIVEVRDNQIFFDRLLNKTFRKKSRFLPKTLRKYYDIIDSENIKPLKNWNISIGSNITKKLSDQEKQQLIQTNGYTNIAPTLKVLPNLLQKYKKTPIVLSQPIKIDGAKKQELSILNGIKEMIKLENPDLKSITAEEFVDEVHNWLQVNYMLGFADEKNYLSYRTDQTFDYLNDRITDQDVDIANMTEEELQRLPFEERQRIANMLGITKQNPDVYHNKVSLRFNDTYHVKSSHFDKSPSAWGNLTYFYTGKNKWKDAVLLHEIQNDNIEYLRNFEKEKIDLESSLNMYLQKLNSDLLENIKQIESDTKYIYRKESWETSNIKKTHRELNSLLETIKDLPLEQGLEQLKGRLDELIEIHKSFNVTLDQAEMRLDKVYSQKRMFQNLQNRGGIKSLLTKEELNNLQDILRGLNRQEEYDNNYISLSDKKAEFEIIADSISVKINEEFKKLYGKDAPIITLHAPGKSRTRSEVRRGVQRSNKLNENVNFLIAFSEKKIIEELHGNIELNKKIWISARNNDVRNKFNVALSKITLEQYATLIENYKHNQDLLKRLIDEQSKKDLDQQTKDQNILEKLKSEIYYSTVEKKWVLELNKEKYEYLPKGLRKKFGSNISKEAVLKDFETYLNNWMKDNNINSYKEILLFKQKENFEALKQEALDKKLELEKNYGKIEEEVKQTLEIEMNYFTPLVHHLIQKHIKQYGKDFPMYLIGFNAGKLTQGKSGKAILSAALYAGKEESNILNKEEIINLKLKVANYLGIIPNDKNTPENIEKIKIYENTKPKNSDDITNKQNLQLAMIRFNGDKPFQTGVIHNLVSKISGVKLIWQDKIDGLKNNTGGYLVDLSNYNYNVPILYGLSENQNIGSANQPTEASKGPMTFAELIKLPQVLNRVKLYLAEDNTITPNEIINKLIIDGIINKDCTI